MASNAATAKMACTDTPYVCGLMDRSCERDRTVVPMRQSSFVVVLEPCWRRRRGKQASAKPGPSVGCAYIGSISSLARLRQARCRWFVGVPVGACLSPGRLSTACAPPLDCRMALTRCVFASAQGGCAPPCDMVVVCVVMGSSGRKAGTGGGGPLGWVSPLSFSLSAAHRP